MVHICYPGTTKEDAEGLGVQGHLQLHREVVASLGYVILSQKTNKLKQNVSSELGENACLLNTEMGDRGLPAGTEPQHKKRQDRNTCTQ